MASFSLDQALERTFKDLKKCWKLSVAYLIHKFKNYYGKHNILQRSTVNSFWSMHSTGTGLWSYCWRIDYKILRETNPSVKIARRWNTITHTWVLAKSNSPWQTGAAQTAAQRHICVPVTVKYSPYPMGNFRTSRLF